MPALSLSYRDSLFFRRRAKEFNVRRWFLSLSAIFAVGLWVSVSYSLSAYLQNAILFHEAEVAQELFQSLLGPGEIEMIGRQSAEIQSYENLAERLTRVARMPGIYRLNVYSNKSEIVWSSDNNLNGHSFPDNDDLQEALGGKLFAHLNKIDAQKEEHKGLGDTGYFTETYIPIYSREPGSPIVGAVELYKNPAPIMESSERGRQEIWIGGFGATVFALLLLYLIVQKAAAIIDRQTVQIAEMHSVALVGEFANAIAHSVRNPIAAIRYSAELWNAQHGDGQQCPNAILQSVDRIDRYLEQLLEYARSDPTKVKGVDPVGILQNALDRGSAALSAAQISTSIDDLRLNSKEICADPAVLEHVFTSIINNAVDAMKSGGKLNVSLREKSVASVVLEFSDNGPGVSSGLAQKIVRGNFSTKDRGFGLGLAMARNAVERWGGRLSFDSEIGRGTTVSLVLKRSL